MRGILLLFRCWVSLVFFAISPLISATTTSSSSTSSISLSPRSPQVGLLNIPSVDVPRIEIFREETSPKNITITRCRAQELSQGGALGIILVLAIGCVVHMPGSITLLVHKGLYRLVPELGIIEAVGLLALVARGKYHHKQSFRLSVKAALALRYALGEGESWWLEDGNTSSAPLTTETFNSALNNQEQHLSTTPISPTEAFQRLEPFLVTIRHFSQARLLGSILTSLALIKACAVSGTIRTTMLASSYYFSFFIIELLAWTALEPGQPPSRGELESDAHACARLMAALDPFRDKISWKHSRWDTNDNPIPSHQRYAAYAERKGTGFAFPTLPESIGTNIFSTLLLILFYVLVLLMAVAILIHLFWPVSVPLFLVYDFTFFQKGKWYFIYLNSFIWFLWISATTLVLFCCAFVISTVRKKSLVDFLDEILPRTWKGANIWLSAYVALKFALIFRLYLTDYAGRNTLKPGWVDWLG